MSVSLASLLANLLVLLSFIYCVWYFLRKKTFSSTITGIFLGILLLNVFGFISILFACSLMLFDFYKTSKDRKISVNYYKIITYILIIILLLYVSSLFNVDNKIFNLLNILTFIFIMLLIPIIFSIRSNWKTMFFRYNNVISWKTILKKDPIFAIAATYSIFKISISSPDISPDILPFYHFIKMLMMMIWFEFLFIIFLLMNQNLHGIQIKKARKIKMKNSYYLHYNENITLFLILISLIISIYFASLVSGQLNDFFLGNIANLNLIFFINITISVFFVHIFMVSMNRIVFKYLDLNSNIFPKDNIAFIKNNVIILIIIYFVFLISIYLAKYFSFVYLYAPFLFMDSLFFYISPPQIYEIITNELNKILLIADIDQLFYFFSVIFTLFIYILFLSQLFIKYSLTSKKYQYLKNKIIDILTSTVEEKGQKCNIIIDKYFRSHPKRIHYFYLIYYNFQIYYGYIFCIFVLLLLANDKLFKENQFILFIFKNYYLILVLLAFEKVHHWIFLEIQKIRVTKITDYINKGFIIKYINFLFSIYLPYGLSALITVSINNSYDVLENYGHIIISKNIVLLNDFAIFILLSYTFGKVFRKVEVLVLNKIEDDS